MRVLFIFSRFNSLRHLPFRFFSFVRKSRSCPPKVSISLTKSRKPRTSVNLGVTAGPGGFAPLGRNQANRRGRKIGRSLGRFQIGEWRSPPFAANDLRMTRIHRRPFHFPTSVFWAQSFNSCSPRGKALPQTQKTAPHLCRRTHFAYFAPLRR